MYFGLETIYYSPLTIWAPTLNNGSAEIRLLCQKGEAKLNIPNLDSSGTATSTQMCCSKCITRAYIPQAFVQLILANIYTSINVFIRLFSAEIYFYTF
jgi:hypothetical protein